MKQMKKHCYSLKLKIYKKNSKNLIRNKINLNNNKKKSNS